CPGPRVPVEDWSYSATLSRVERRSDRFRDASCGAQSTLSLSATGNNFSGFGAGRIMLAIWARALAYLLVVGGGWLLVLPAGLLTAGQGGWQLVSRPLPVTLAGGGLFALGCGLACWAAFCLIKYGYGTPLPLDPPRLLVVCGPYHRVRNPQGIAMLLM